MKRLDVVSGTLIKSPCKDCEKAAPPGCRENCKLLDAIQQALSEAIMTSNQVGDFDTYDVPGQVLSQI